MAAFFLLLAIIGGALVGDLVWENTTAGEVTVLDRTVGGYPQGWLLAAAALGFVVALLLVASMSSTKSRRTRRRQLRSMKHDLRDRDMELGRDHAAWLDESLAVARPRRTPWNRPSACSSRCMRRQDAPPAATTTVTVSDRTKLLSKGSSMTIRRSVLVAVVGILVALVSPLSAHAAPGGSGTTGKLPESNAEALVILSNHSARRRPLRLLTRLSG